MLSLDAGKMQNLIFVEGPVRIGELAGRTGISARMLRYYEEQGLLTPERTSSGYRSYPESAVSQAGQIRGLLDAGLTTEIIRTILPCLNDPEDVRRTVGCLPAAAVELIRAELGRVQQRIDCLTRNRDAIEAYLANQPAAVNPARRNPGRPAAITYLASPDCGAEPRLGGPFPESTASRPPGPRKFSPDGRGATRQRAARKAPKSVN